MTSRSVSFVVVVASIWCGATFAACSRPLRPECDCPLPRPVIEGPHRVTAASHPAFVGARAVVKGDGAVAITYEDGGATRTVVYRIATR